jgi:adsorption protein B
MPLVCWILLNGVDDLSIAIAWVFLPRAKPRLRQRRPSRTQPTRIAIFVPLWQEHRVIERMVARNIGSIQYSEYEMFLGAYPNDAATLAAIAEASKRFPNVHLAPVPHDGPTSKADCLNWIYHRMSDFEKEHGIRFDMVLTHDAEDVIHPDALARIDDYAGCYEMIQIPVLALSTPWWELTHGVYCDEFAQMELLDMPVRQMLGGFLPSSGVGTAFSRRILKALAANYNNRIFEPVCLTEDYENGFRVNWLGGRQLFVRLAPGNQPPIATREYFPRKFRAAVRQRTRWITGIALQSWELHNFRETKRYLYWFWRDRKSLVSNLASGLANLVTLYAIARGGLPVSPPLRHAIDTALGILSIQMAVRMACSARVYGWKFALATPIRMIWANGINGLATLMAVRNFCSAKIQGKPLRWIKTDHAYPTRPLAKFLVESGYVKPEVLARKPSEMPLVRYVLSTGDIDQGDLYAAISEEQNLPIGRPDEISVPVTRSFPSDVARRWSVLPFKLVAGSLHVAGSEPPTEEMHIELSAFSSMEIRFQLITPTEFEELAEEYLPTGSS